MKTEKISICILALLLLAALAGFGLYIRSEANRNLAFEQTSEERVTEMQTRVDTATAAVSDLEGQLAGRKDEVMRLQEEITQARNTAQTGSANLAARDQQLQQVNQRLAAQAQQMTSLRQNLATAEEQRAASQSALADQKTKLGKAVTLIKRQQAAIRAQRAEIARLKQPALPPPAPVPTQD